MKRSCWRPALIGPTMLIYTILALGGTDASVAARPVDTADPVNQAEMGKALHDHVVHNVGLLWNHVTNFGLIGSWPTMGSPYSDTPSARWPGDTGLDHLFSAGLWVGGDLLGNREVSTGQYEMELQPTDAPDDTIHATARGEPGGNRYPWSLPDDDGDGLEDEDPPNGQDDDGDGLVDEDFAAISQQHFRCRYYDNTAAAQQQYPDHDPLNLEIIQQSFQWTMPLADDFIGYDFTIRNIGVTTIDNVYIGMFADFDIPAVVGGAEDDHVGMYRGLVQAANGSWVTVNLGYMYEGGPGGLVPGYAGFVLCGHTTDATGQIAPQAVDVLSFQRFSGQLAFDQGGDPTNDDERYKILFATADDPNSPPGQQDDYRFVISSGPFPELAPDETITYQVALVAGAGLDDLLANAAEAVLTYQGAAFDRDGNPANGDEFVVNWLRQEDIPVAAASGSLAATATGGEVRLGFETNQSSADDLLVERRAGSGSGTAVRRWSAAEFDQITITSEGVRGVLVDREPAAWPRTYSLLMRTAAGEHRLDEIEIASPAPAILSLRASPNPFNPRVELHYSVPRSGPVRLRIYDARGQLTRRLLLDAVPAGPGVVVWEGDDEHGRAAASGVYTVQIEAGGSIERCHITLVR